MYLIAPSICIFHNQQEVLPKLIVPIYVDPTTAMEEMNARIKEYWRKYRQKQRSPNAICKRDSNKETTKTAPQNKVSVCIIHFGFFRNTDCSKNQSSDCSIHIYFSYCTGGSTRVYSAYPSRSYNCHGRNECQDATKHKCQA